MKKVLLFGAALCLMISAQAQIGTKKSDENSLKSRLELLNNSIEAHLSTRKSSTVWLWLMVWPPLFSSMTAISTRQN